MTQTQHEQLRAFADHYAYDTSYMEFMLEAAPDAFAAFAAAQGMSEHRQALPVDDHHVAHVATMQGEDCGPCAQLNLRMAVEAGVDRGLLQCLLDDPSGLPSHLRDVRDHATAVASGGDVDQERVARLRAHYGDTAFAELALSIAGCSLYPTLKRALGYGQHCEALTLDF